ncbi:MAG: C1 family peptidase [Myxococcales bacterium]|nr:C1 family peptidase [Myxococcales bacterium]
MRVAHLLPLLALFGCGDSLYDFLGQGGRPLKGDDAFQHLAVDPAAAAPVDLAAVMTVLGDEERQAAGEDAVFADDADVLKLRRRSVQQRLAIDESRFELVDFAEWGDVVQKQSCDLSVNVRDLYDEYVIPQAERVPVRNQGARGTCAAFAGTASMEYAALNTKAGGYDLKTLDLSEQRFYWLSKPECQGPSGDCGAGSWFGSGFDAAKSGKGFPVPLEADCPYNTSPGANDTQYPHPASCERGAARVDAVETWCGLEGLVDLLHRGFAVPIGSPLTANWEQNEGLITKRDFAAQGSTVHAGGHAYLIIGYRKLPKMPEEGGLCFIIKNSWGKGWGVNGHACMTLAWMEAVGGDRFTYGFPAVTKVTLAEGGPRPAPTPAPVPEVEPEPEPEPEPVVAWTSGRLRGPDDTLHRVQQGAVPGGLWLRGGDGDAAPLKLDRRGDRLFYQEDEVGEVTDVITVCTGEWEALCALRRDDDRLLVQFRDPDLRAVKSWEYGDDRGDWKSVPVTGRTSAIFLPKEVDAGFLADPKIFLKINGSQPLRLALRPTDDLSNFAIKLMGIEVGRIDVTAPQDAALCTGRFADTCRLIGTDRLSVLPGNRRAGKTVRQPKAADTDDGEE